MGRGFCGTGLQTPRFTSHTFEGSSPPHRSLLVTAREPVTSDLSTPVLRPSLLLVKTSTTRTVEVTWARDPTVTGVASPDPEYDTGGSGRDHHLRRGVVGLRYESKGSESKGVEFRKTFKTFEKS